MAAQVAAVKAHISSHETLNPPRPGKWSILRSHPLPSDFDKLLGSFTKETLPFGSTERTEVIRILWDWLAVWDVRCWPADGAQSRASFEKCSLQLHQLDTVRWEMVQLMRYDVPSRIAETHEHCAKLLAWVKARRDYDVAMGHSDLSPLIETEPQLFLYAGVALAQAGLDPALAEKHLRGGTTYLGQIGSLNPLWALGSLERVLRVQGKEDEALVVQRKLVTYVLQRPNSYSPRALRELLLWPGETTTPTLAKLGVAEHAKDDKPFSLVSASKANDFCFNCGDSGLLKKLKECSMCSLVKYCGAACQRAHWKAGHKISVSARNSREELALTRDSRNAPQFGEDFQEWCQAMLSVVNEAGYSAFELSKGAANSKVLTHLFAIGAEWNPRGVEPIDRFNIVRVTFMTEAEAKQSFGAEAVLNLNKQIRAFEARDASACIAKGTVYGRTLLVSSGTGVNVGLGRGSTSMVSAYPSRLAKERKHDAAWSVTLSRKKETWGYQHQ